jgi:hypothetical protein
MRGDLCDIDGAGVVVGGCGAGEVVDVVAGHAEGEEGPDCLGKGETSGRIYFGPDGADGLGEGGRAGGHWYGLLGER